VHAAVPVASGCHPLQFSPVNLRAYPPNATPAQITQCNLDRSYVRCFFFRLDFEAPVFWGFTMLLGIEAIACVRSNRTPIEWPHSYNHHRQPWHTTAGA
jgi:hypothetical protein